MILIASPAFASVGVRDLDRDDRFTANQTGESLMVTRSTHQVIAVAIKPESNVVPADSLSQIVINVKKSVKANIIDTITMYIDADSNAFYSAGDPVLSQQSGGVANGETAQYTIFPNRVMTYPESFLVNISFNQNLTTGDTLQIYFNKDASPTGYSQLYIYNPISAAVGVPRAITNDTNSLLYTARIDSVGLTVNALANATIHPDSRLNQNPLTVFSGHIQGETRGMDTDKLVSLGVEFQGRCADSITSAWALLGASGQLITMDRIAPTSWRSSATLDSALTVNRGETFIVKIRMADTVQLGETVAAYILKDSIVTRVRPLGPSANSATGGTFTFQKQRVFITTANLGNTAIHPDSRAVGGVHGIMVCSGVLSADTITGITNDSITIFGMALNFGSGMAFNDVESVSVAINGETFRLTQDGVRDSWFASLTKQITDTASFQVWLRVKDTTPLNGTVSPTLGTDSITTAYRQAGPMEAVSAQRTVTFTKQRVYAITQNIGNIATHPDSRAVGGVHGVLLCSGVIAGDSYTGITHDTSINFGVRLAFGAGMAFNDVESVSLIIGAETFTLTQDGTTDTWFRNAITKRIDDTMAFRVYVRSRDTVPNLGTVTASLLMDSLTTFFRQAGPPAEVAGQRTITFTKQRIYVNAANLTNISLHPDSRAVGGVHGTLLCSGTISADSYTGIVNDTVNTFGLALIYGGGMTQNDIESIAVVIAGETFALAKDAPNDSWFKAAIGRQIIDTGSFQVWIRVKDTIPLNASCSAVIATDSLNSTFRLTGPPAAVSGVRTITYEKQRVYVNMTNLGAVSVHPDSRAVGGQQGTVVCSGTISADTLSFITNDTITKFGVSLVFGAGMAMNDVESVGVTINGTSYSMARNATSDSWQALLTTPITDTANFQIYVRARETAPINATLTAWIPMDSITTTFRANGPHNAESSNRTVTYQKQRIYITTANLGNIANHPDSHVIGGLQGVLLCSGTIAADTLTSIVNDSVTLFGSILTFGGTMTFNDVETMLVAINGESFPMSRIGVTDSWFAAITKPIADTAQFQIWLRARETTPLNGTVTATIPMDSVTSVFRAAGPMANVLSNRTVTFTKQRVYVTPAVLGNTSLHPDSRIVGSVHGVMICSGIIAADSYTGIVADSITNFGISLIMTGGMTRNDVESMALAINGETFAMIREANADSWYASINKLVSDTSSFQVYLRARETTPHNSVCSAFINMDSIVTAWRQKGSDNLVAFGRDVTYTKQRVYVTMANLGNVVAHPDSRAVGSVHGVMICSGVIAYDTIAGVVADSVRIFGVRLTYGAGMAMNDIESMALAINGETFAMSLVANTTDSWMALIAKHIADTASFQVYLRAKDTTPQNGTVSAEIPMDSITTNFRTAGPPAFSNSNRTVTVAKQRVYVVPQDLGNVSVHPDSRIVGSVHGVMVCSGIISGDSYSGIITDSITSFGVSLNFGGGMAFNDVESVALAINGETFAMTREAASDSWRAAINKMITDTASFQVYLRARETTVINGTVIAMIQPDSILTSFRLRGPDSAIAFGRTTTYHKQKVYISVANLGNVAMHPDSRAIGSVHGLMICSGVISYDTIGGVVADSVTLFGTRLTFGGGMAMNDVESMSVAINGETFAMTRTAGTTDSWAAIIAKHIADTASFQVYLRAKDTTPNLGTVAAEIPVDSITTKFRFPGPAVFTSGGRTVTYTRQRVYVTMQNIGGATVHPDSRTMGGVHGVMLCSGVIHGDSYTSITHDTVTSFGVGLAFGAGMSFNDVESISVAINGETFALARDAAQDSWFRAAMTKRIVDTASFEVFLRARETTQVNAVCTASIRVDSITTTFRFAGPDSHTASNRTCTFTKPTVDSSMIFIGNDTKHPQVASTIPFVVARGNFNWDTRNLITSNRDTVTGLVVYFAGTAGDSARNVQLQINPTGVWQNMSKLVGTNNDTYYTITLDSAITIGVDTFAIRMTVSDTVVKGGTLSAHMAAYRCTTAFSKPGPLLNSESSGVFTFNSNPVVVLRGFLGDTMLAPWDTVIGPHTRGFETNPILVCTGTINTNIGSVVVPGWDTLTRFGIAFDSTSTSLLVDSIVSVTMRFWDTGFTSYRDTAMIPDSLPIQDSRVPLSLVRYWKLSGDTRITETQPFQVWVRVMPHEKLIPESFFVRIVPDSAMTYYASASGGDTHSSRRVMFVHPDTTKLFQSVEYESSSSSYINPIYDTQAIITGGYIRGLQWNPARTDTLQGFQVELFDGTAGQTPTDSIASVTLLFGPDTKPIGLSWIRTYVDPTFGVRVKVYGNNAIDSRFSSTANYDSFFVMFRVFDTVVVNNPLNFLRARIWSESVSTYFCNESTPAAAVLSGKAIFFQTIAFNANAYALTNVSASPFRAQTDSILALSGKIISCQTPTDSLTGCTLQLVGSSRFRGESVTVYLALDSGTATPATQVALVLSDSASSSPRFRLGTVPVNIDTAQTFKVYIQADTSMLVGETVTAYFSKYTALSARFSYGAPDTLSSGRVISYIYTDTIKISDSTPSAALTVHPDTRMSQNPFTIYEGALLGQSSVAALRDTFTRFGVEFLHTAATKVVAAWLVTPTETVALVQVGTSATWRATLDSTGAYQTTLPFKVIVRVGDTVPTGDTLQVRINSDSARAHFCAETVAITGLRTVTFDHSRVTVSLNSIGTRNVHPDSHVGPLPVALLSGRLDTTAVGGTVIPYDTVTSFSVKLLGTVAQADVESVALQIQKSTGLETVALALSSWPDYTYATQFNIFDSAIFRISINVHPSAHGKTVTAVIPADSIRTTLRDSGPSAQKWSADTVTFDKGRVALTLNTLGAKTVHPDSRVNMLPTVMMNGRLDTVTIGGTKINNDTITRVNLRLDGTIVQADVERVSLMVQRATGTIDTVVMTLGTWPSYSYTADSIVISDSMIFGVSLGVHPSANGKTAIVSLGPDSIVTALRDTGPSAITMVTTDTVTFDRGRTWLVLTDTNGSRNLHPDSRQQAYPIVILAGRIDSTVVGGTRIPYDTMTTFRMNLGQDVDTPLAATDIETAILSIGGTDYTLTKSGTHLSYVGNIQISDSSYFFIKFWPNPTAEFKKIWPYIGKDSIIMALRESGPVAQTRNAAGDTVYFTKPTLTMTMGPRPIDYPYTVQVTETSTIGAINFKSNFTGDSIVRMVITLAGNPATLSAVSKFWLVKDENNDSKFTYAFDSALMIPLVGSTVGTESRYVFNRVAENTRIGDTSRYLVVVIIDSNNGVVGDTTLRASVAANQCTTTWMAVAPASTIQYETFMVVNKDTTAPLPPINFTATPNPGSILLTFGPSPSGDTQMLNGQYNLYWDSGVGNWPETVIAAIPHVSLQTSYSYTLTNLVADREYRFMLKSQDQAGNIGDATQVVTVAFRSATAPAAVSTVTLIQPAAGDRVYYDTTTGNNKISLISQLTSGSATNVTSVTFEFRTMSGGNWITLGTATDSSYDASGNVYYSINYESSSILNDSTLEFRAVAITTSGRDTYAQSITATTSRDTARCNYVMIAGTNTLTDSTYVEGVVTTKAGSDVMIIRTPAGAFDVVITYGQGSLANDTTRAIVRAQRGNQSDTLSNACKRGAVLIPEYWAEVVLQSGQIDLGGQGATITVNYLDLDGNNIDDSTGVDMSKAKIFTVDANGNIEQLSDIVWNRSRRTLSGRTMHFSPIFVSNTTGDSTVGLSQLIVGPNPYRPNDGNDQTGKPWVNGDATTGIIFKNLPNNSKIQIYTILGERVTEFSNGTNGPTASWSVKNDDNRDVASGYYLYIVTDPATNQRVTGKVAVIR